MKMFEPSSIKAKKKKNLNIALTVVIPAALLEGDTLVAEGLADTVLPRNAVVARPAVCSAVWQVSGCCHRNPSSSRNAAG